MKSLLPSQKFFLECVFLYSHFTGLTELKDSFIYPKIEIIRTILINGEYAPSVTPILNAIREEFLSYIHVRRGMYKYNPSTNNTTRQLVSTINEQINYINNKITVVSGDKLTFMEFYNKLKEANGIRN